MAKVRRKTLALMPAHTGLPDYESPPVNEVVIGLVFQPLVSFRVVHFGLVWERIREEFPHIEHAPPLGIEQAVLSAPVTSWLPLLMPRIWYINRTKDKLVQLQQDRLYINWRLREEGEPYPRFPAMFKLYEKTLATVADVFEQENLGEIVPTTYELRYVNHILKGQGWSSFLDAARIFPDFAWRDDPNRFLPPPIGGSWSAVFSLPKQMGQLSVRAQPVQKAVKDSTQELIALEITANSSTSGIKVDAAKEWFDVAYEWIVRGFADLTSLEVQRTHWKRKDGNA